MIFLITMSSEICNCTDEICETVKGSRELHTHKDGSCHHPDGTHHPIHSTTEETHCPKCNGQLKSSVGCHVHEHQCCKECEWGR